MKLLVDEMPYYAIDCIFYDGRDCKITERECERALENCRESSQDECECLMTYKAYERIKDNYD